MDPELTERRLPGGLLMLRPDGTIIEAPTFFLEALEVAQDESIYDLFSQGRQAHMTISRVFANANGSREYHVQVQQELGDPLSFRYWDVTPNAQSTIAFFVVDDSSVQMSQEWRHRRLRRNIMDDVSEFAAEHLVGPLANLRALTDVLKERPDDAREAAERIFVTLDDLDRAVGRLTERVERDTEDETPLPVRVADVASVVTSWSDKMVKIECEADFVPASVFVPAVVVEDILSPIVSNAIEARPRDGIVHVRIHDLGAKVAFEVIDSGRGMTRHELARAEDPFFTTKRGHSGLGLSTAREALRSVGGYWNYTSSRRKGTRVRVVVPTMEMEGVFSEAWESD